MAAPPPPDGKRPGTVAEPSTPASDQTRPDPDAATEDIPVAGDVDGATTASDGGNLPQTPDVPTTPAGARWTLAGLVLVIAVAWLVQWLEEAIPEALADTPFGELAAGIEYPVYAIAVGLAVNAVITSAGIRERLSGAFRTEFFIKTGLVLLGASINLSVLVSAAGPAILQSLLLVSGVFAFAWWFGGKVGLDDKLRALLASAVSICGVSAAIAAAGAVQAKKEQLVYSANLVVLFALPSIFILPAAATALGLSPAVTGAWIGGNIDTTAAVTAAGALAGEEALQIAAIVKSTQNALMGFVAVALTAYFAFKVDRRPGSARPHAKELWTRFPKFVLGFIAASVIATLYLQGGGDSDQLAAANSLRTWFLVLAFVSIGLEFKVSSIREAGWRPVGVFAASTLVNVLLALGLASLLFAGVTAIS